MAKYKAAENMTYLSSIFLLSIYFLPALIFLVAVDKENSNRATLQYCSDYHYKMSPKIEIRLT